MVAHLAVSVATPSEPFANLTKQGQPVDAVRIAEEDVLSAIAPGGNMIEASGYLDAQWSGHGGKVG